MVGKGEARINECDRPFGQWGRRRKEKGGQAGSRRRLNVVFLFKERAVAYIIDQATRYIVVAEFPILG